MKRRLLISACFIAVCIFAVGLMIKFGMTQEKRTDSPVYAQLMKYEELLTPIHKPMGDPQPGDWLASHEEPGQSFAQYVRSKPNQLSGQRKVLYVQPIGVFDRKRTEIVELSAEFMGLYFGCPVKVLDTMPDAAIPKKARRIHPEWEVRQILTTHVLYDVLKPNLPADAFALIAFTSSDLWPGDGWNFVFGQASLRERVGVWSISRNGDPNLSEEDFLLCMRRTIKTATHETGHMFSMQHCIKFECNMSGSNSREESDRYPLYLCPKCLAKVIWSTGNDPVPRYESLARFCDAHELEKEATFYRKSIELLQQ